MHTPDAGSTARRPTTVHGGTQDLPGSQLQMPERCGYISNSTPRTNLRFFQYSYNPIDTEKQIRIGLLGIYKNSFTSVQQARHCRTNVVRLLYDCRTNVVRLLCDCRTNVVRLLYDCRTNVVRLLYDCRTNVVRLLYDCRTNVVRLLSIVVRMLYDYCTIVV